MIVDGIITRRWRTMQARIMELETQVSTLRRKLRTAEGEMRLSASPLPYTKALSVSTGTQAASDCWVTGSLSRNGKDQSLVSFLVGAFYHITINCYMFAVLLVLVTCI